jgi:cell wall-associated NlpC family hydrolase
MPHKRNSFSLSGPSRTLDPRVNAMRGDLADVALAGKHFSPHYASPVERFCSIPFAPICDKPNGDQVSELLAGEAFMLLDISGGWAWGFSKHDHYVGYVLAEALTESAAHLNDVETRDPVDAARSFLDKPYVWGGRGGVGIDCSGLIQRSLAAANIGAPRDSDMQQASLGTEIEAGAPLQRGDLVFFPGHVGMMVDNENIIHATRNEGKTLIEPLAAVIARIAENCDSSVLSRRRISS